MELYPERSSIGRLYRRASGYPHQYVTISTQPTGDNAWQELMEQRLRMLSYLAVAGFASAVFLVETLHRARRAIFALRSRLQRERSPFRLDIFFPLLFGEFNRRSEITGVRVSDELR